ncbi:MAG: hypothetical protein V4688_06530 [Pseudomonadota bacterium]
MRRSPLALAAAASLLSACQSAPPKPVQPFFVAGLPVSLLQPHGGFRLDQPVRYPALTRYASLASRAPQYGLMANPDPEQPAFAVQSLDKLFRVSHQVNAEFLRQLQANAPALASQTSAAAKAAWRFDVRRVAIFGKDVGNTRCEAMWFMRADLVDDTGALLWSSGFANSRLNDKVGYSCARIGTDPIYAAQVVQAALNGAVTDIIRKVVSSP